MKEEAAWAVGMGVCQGTNGVETGLSLLVAFDPGLSCV